MHFKIVIILLFSVVCISFVNGQYYNYYNYYNANPYTVQSSQPSIQLLPDENLQCAKLWEMAYYKGRTLDFKPNDKKSDLGQYYFRPQSVKVKSGCSFTIFDDYGTSQGFEKDNQWIWWNQRLSAACCDCGSCEGESAMKDLQCARLYENEKCNSCTGYRLDLKNGDKVRSFGPLDNRMSSIAVKPGCQLVVFFEENFQGWRYNFTRSANLFGDNWYKQISSAECFCLNEPNPTPYPYPTAYPSTPTTQYTTRPTTLQTKPTTTPWTTTSTTMKWTTPPTTTESDDDWDKSSEEEITTKPTTTPWTTTSTTTKWTTPPTTTEADYDWDKSSEEVTTKPTTTPWTTTSTTTKWTNPPTTTEADDDWDKSSEEEVTTKPTTTTTSTTTTTTTEFSVIPDESWETTKEEEDNTEESEEDNDFFSNEEDEEPTTTPAPVTTTAKPTTTTTTKAPTTTRATTTKEAEETDDGWGDDW